MIYLLFFNALVIWGFYFACQFENHEQYDLLSKDQRLNFAEPRGKMIFWWVRYYWRGSDFWAKPVFTCVMCMSSFHSILPYFYTYGINAESLIEYPFYVMALAGLNAGLMYKVYN